MDVFYKEKNHIFCHKVAGILVRNGKVLLKASQNKDSYSFPGGCVLVGKTSIQSLIKKFEDELGLQIVIKSLRWVGEVFFTFEDKPCHEICLYYAVSLIDNEKLIDNLSLSKKNNAEKENSSKFLWLPINDFADSKIFPNETKELMLHYSPKIRHFVSYEK